MALVIADSLELKNYKKIKDYFLPNSIHWKVTQLKV